MSACVNKLKLGDMGVTPDYILVDGNRLPDDFCKEKAQFVIKVDILPLILWEVEVIQFYL
jgi:hypothetical protein